MPGARLCTEYGEREGEVRLQGGEKGCSWGRWFAQREPKIKNKRLLLLCPGPASRPAPAARRRFPIAVAGACAGRSLQGLSFRDTHLAGEPGPLRVQTSSLASPPQKTSSEIEIPELERPKIRELHRLGWDFNTGLSYER